MTSWAAIARVAPAPVQASAPASADKEGARLAVIDANAIISGLRLQGLADKLVTIQEVLDEIKDEQSRKNLEALPVPLELRQPTPESVAAVVKFAKETGDAHALSAADVKLLALAHTLEVAAHGSAHLRQHAVKARVSKRKTSGVRKLPGWDVVADAQGWKLLDQVPEGKLGHGGGAGSTSRIIQQVRSLGLGGSEEAAEDGSSSGPAGSAVQPAGPSATGNTVVAEPAPTGAAAIGPPAPGPGSAAGDSRPPVGTEDCEEEDEGEEDGDGDDGWNIAASSRNAGRRKAKKAARYQAWLQSQGGGAGGGRARAPSPPPLSPPPEEAEAAPPQASSGEGGEEEEWESVTTEGEQDEAASAAAGAADTEEGTEETELGLNTTSSVLCVTADFAMQNVLLQMGLRLVSLDGQQISRLSRWVLRCTACFFVTKEAGRLFCPRCGNSTVERVEVSVGPDGAEYFGIRKKHVLKGTRFSLPKPRGGRNAHNPILAEDTLMEKMAKRRPPKKADGDPDPFAPEFTQDTWFKVAQAASGGKGAKLLLTNWKNNPNERKNARTSRRG